MGREHPEARYPVGFLYYLAPTTAPEFIYFPGHPKVPGGFQTLFSNRAAGSWLPSASDSLLVLTHVRFTLVLSSDLGSNPTSSEHHSLTSTSSTAILTLNEPIYFYLAREDGPAVLTRGNDFKYLDHNQLTSSYSSNPNPQAGLTNKVLRLSRTCLWYKLHTVAAAVFRAEPQRTCKNVLSSLT